jgi:predicted transcriptional regulator
MSNFPNQLEIDDITKEKVLSFSAAHNKSATSIFQEAIAEYVEREERREKLRLEVTGIWQAYQQTGLHVTAAEADAWLAKLENGERVPPPRCHT